MLRGSQISKTPYVSIVTEKLLGKKNQTWRVLHGLQLSPESGASVKICSAYIQIKN